MDASRSENDPKDDFKGGVMMGAQEEIPFAHEKQVDKGFSDLEVVPTADLEVAGSDASQAIPPPVYRPKFTEQQSFAMLSSPGATYSQNGASNFSRSPSESKTRDYNYNGGHDPFHSSEDPERNRMILGLKRKVFWIVLAVMLLGIMLAIAVGLGVGLGLRSTNDASSSANPTSTSAPNTTTTTTKTSTTTTGLPAATATDVLDADTDIICPTANRTMYSDPSSTTGQKFLVLCGRDYNSNQGAVDLTSMNITTFEGCVSECGNTEGCIAVGWGSYNGYKTCWLKSSIGEPNVSADWYAAVEDSNS